MAKRPIFLAIVVAAAVAMVVSITVLGFPPGRSDPEAFAHVFPKPSNGNETHLHVDANPNNGTRPCGSLDDTRTVAVGDTYDVALCLEHYAATKVEAFKLRLYYDSINTSPTLVGDAPMLDLNPDANDGDDDVTGLTLGGGWDCSGFGAFPPVGDDVNTPCQDQFGQPITPCHDAVIACVANIGLPDQDLSADPGLLATVQFTATGAGTELLTWGSDTEVGGSDVGLPDGGTAICGADVPADQIGCFGATLTKEAFDCTLEDPLRETSLTVADTLWEFDSPDLEGAVRGEGGVRRIGNRLVVVGRAPGFFVIAIGTCPAGPGLAFGINMTGVGPGLLRVVDPGIVAR